MDEVDIKVEVEDDGPNCLLCLQPVSFVINQERLNSLNFLFNYLEIDEIEVYVCDKCGEKVAKCVKLLEKIIMEMDYLLDSIKSDILKSNNFKPMCFGVASLRKMVVKKCLEKRQNQQLKVILERLDSSKVNGRDQSSTSKVVDIKPDVNFEDSTIPKAKGKRRYCCQVPGCDKSYSTTPKLDGHYRAQHPDFIQPLRRRRKVLEDKFDVIVENGDSVWCCKLCEKKFKSWKTAKQHLKKVHGPKKFLCSECGYATAVKEQLRLHVKRVHKKDLIEPGTSDLNPSLESISTTLVWERGGGGDTEELHAEMDDIANADPTPNPIPSPTADKDFSLNVDEGSNLSSNLLDEVLNEAIEASRRAPVNSQTNLKDSPRPKMKRKRRRPEMTKCPTCSKMFSSKGHLKIHVNSVHLGVRRFKCSSAQCSKSYDSSVDLEDHINTIHLQLKAHLCDICAKSFGYKRDLKQHRDSVHFKLKSYTCDRCAASFTQNSSLNQHIRNVHLGVKRKNYKSKLL